MKRASWFTFILLLSISCLDSPDCFELNHNFIGLSFKVMGTGKADTLRFNNIQISGTDSIFIPSQRAIALALPLDFTHDESSIYFVSYRGKDTLRVGYNVNTQFVSEDCGSRFVLTALNLFRSSFDSVRIISNTPSNKASSNIEIYRCPRTDTMAISFRQLTYVASNGAKSNQAMSVPLDGVTPDFTGQALYVDQRPTTIYLPVNMTDPHMKLNFVLADGTQRTLDLTYTLTTGVRYKVCGEQTYATEMKIVPGLESLAFDSVSFVRDAQGRQITSVLDPFDPMIHLYQCPQTNIAGIYFRKGAGGADTVVVNDVLVDGVSLPLVSNSLSSVNVPLNPTASTTTITFNFQSGEVSAITLSHTREERMMFPACGRQSLFSNLNLAATTFDTVGLVKEIKIPNPNLPSIPTRNIEIIQR